MRKVTLDDGTVMYEVLEMLMTPEEFERAFAPQAQVETGFFGWKPIKSDALAVHPKQIAEAVALAQKLGCPTEFTKDGRPIFRTRQHRKAYMQQHGFFDKAGGYGDAQPGQTKRDIPDRPDVAKEYF